jgi:hypothetical protein
MHIVMRWVTFLVALGLFLYFSKYEFGPFADQHKGHKTLDGTTFYKPSSVRPLLDGLGTFLPNYLIQERTVDLMFPFIYGLMLMVPIVSLARGARAPWWLAALPILAVAGDFCENFTVMALIKRYPGDLGGLPYVASIASGAKGVGLFGSLAAIIVFAVLWIVHARAA